MDDSDTTMLSASLKERLAQYRTLKEEEERNEGVASAPDPPLPNEAAEPDDANVEKGFDTQNSYEEYEVEEIVESEQEFIEQEIVDGSFVDPNDDASFEEVDVEPEGETQEGQDVFKALDEAERAETGFSNSETGASPATERNVSNEKTKSTRRIRCIIFGLLAFALIAVVAIVLPFFIDYTPDSETDSETPPSQAGPIEGRPGSIKPTITSTDAPTPAPTTLQWSQFLKTFLIPVSGEDIFQDEKSPQYRAAKYILDDPYTGQLTTAAQLNDRYATATFYFATEGDNWDKCSFGDANCTSGQWLVDDVCDWYGVSCNNDGRVASFLFANVEGNGLVGSLPYEMYLLSEMTDLVIVNNALTGTLPEAFGDNATSMRSLLLPDNKLSGKIPENYLSNSPLEFVHLGGNAFSGSIPTNIGNSAHLQQLDLSGNLLTGIIPDTISRYEYLEALSFASNGVMGTIPEGIFDLTNLKFLHMSGNELEGTISPTVGHLLSLKELRLGQSRLSGYIPDELYTLTDLVELDLSQSQFDGRLSLGLLDLKNLEKLTVDGNNLVGTISGAFGSLYTLSELKLEGNEFSGTIPNSVCMLREGNLDVLTADCEKLTCECCSKCF